MKTKDLKIGGKTYKVGFDFAVICNYEEETGKAFDLTELTSVSKLIRLIYHILQAFNMDAPELDELQHMLTNDDIKKFNEVVLPIISDFFKLPASEKADEKDGEGSPNA